LQNAKNNLIWSDEVAYIHTNGQNMHNVDEIEINHPKECAFIPQRVISSKQYVVIQQ